MAFDFDLKFLLPRHYIPHEPNCWEQEIEWGKKICRQMLSKGQLESYIS